LEKFDDMQRREWRQAAQKADRPAAIKVVMDVYGRVVPLASNPLIEEDSKPYVVAMPDDIPDSWKPSDDTAEEYVKAMTEYQNKIKERKMNLFERNKSKADPQDPDSVKERQESAERNARKGFGKASRKGKKGRANRKVRMY
jgi:hypothetical protein